MTSKDLHIAIKNGHGVQYMMERHHFCDEESLFEAIRGVCPIAASDFINSLKKNQKQLDKKARRNTKAGVEDVSAEESSNIGTAEELNVQSFEEQMVESCEETDAEEEEKDFPEFNLEQLLTDETELSQILCGLESDHKRMVAERIECRKGFQKSLRAMQELQRILKAQQEIVAVNYQKYLELDLNMQRNNKERAEYSELIEMVRSQIAELTKITIIIEENGVIGVENAKIPSISEESLNIGMTELISFPDAEELTIKQLRTIARVRLMVEALKEEGSKIEVMFEDIKLQSFYEATADNLIKNNLFCKRVCPKVLPWGIFFVA